MYSYLWVDSDELGESYDSARDLCFFLVKELGKAFSVIEILLQEYHSLTKLKEFLYAELCTFHIECAIVKQTMNKHFQNLHSEEFQEMKKVGGLNRVDQPPRGHELEA